MLRLLVLLKPLEMKLLRELHRNLSPEAQGQFRKQLDGINRVQRQANKQAIEALIAADPK